MSEYIKREDVRQAVISLHGGCITDAVKDFIDYTLLSVPSADVVEIGKAYPREEFEKYGLSEWKDKHGQRWVMIERADVLRKVAEK